jgi:hypothetical protein
MLVRGKLLAGLCVLALSSSASPSLAQEKEEQKKSIIDALVPDSIKAVADVATQVLGVYTGITGALDTITGLATALGILQPAMGPNITELFQDLTSNMNEIAGEIDWKISATARDERYGKAMSAFFAVMHASQGGTLDAQILANADTNSIAVINEIMGPGESAFMRTAANEIISGDWENYIDDRAPIINGAVYDWRLAIPELMQYLAIRLQIIAAIDPAFREHGTFKNELLSYRDFLVEHAERMRGGVICKQTPAVTDRETGRVETVHLHCANIYTGGSVEYGEFPLTGGFPQREIKPELRESVRERLFARMPLEEISTMIEQLEEFAQ